VERRIGQGSWRDYRWSVLVEPDGDEQFLTADLTASDGRRHGSGMGGPITWPDSPLNVYAGRADGFPVVVLVRTDRARNLGLTIDGADAEPIWAQVRGGVHYLLHLIPASELPQAVEVVGRSDSGTVREAVRLP
jgi:hypothetical protein